MEFKTLRGFFPFVDTTSRVYAANITPSPCFLVSKEKLRATGDMKPRVIPEPRRPRRQGQVCTFRSVIFKKSHRCLTEAAACETQPHQLKANRLEKESYGSEGALSNHIMPPKPSSKRCCCLPTAKRSCRAGSTEMLR